MKGAPFVECAGWGLATPLGTSMPSTWAALMQGRYITDHATVPLAADDTPRTTQLGLHVAREAITAVGWSAGDLRDDQTALVIGTSKGPIVNWLTPSGSPQPSGGITGGLSQIATDLAGGLNLGHGPRLTLSAACASGLHALIRAVMLLHFGHATRAVVVAVESSVHPLFLASFQRLGVLPKRGNRCRPFDLRRDGFLMSEAAAAVCLETTDEPGSRCIYVDRFALGGAAGHLTAGDKDGTLWRRLLSRVIGQNPVDLIHAHATGTVLHDPIELAAIEDVVTAQSTPIVYSHKGALGHSLGAAGLVAVALNCEVHTRGQVPANSGLIDPLPTRHTHLSVRPVVRPVRRSIAMASGFGGPTAVMGLVLR